MSDPQPEHGYSRIAHELMDAIIRAPLSKRQYKVVFAVIRKTYGYNKKTDDMPLTQIIEMTGLDKGNLSKTINELEAMSVITKGPGDHGFILGLNKDFEAWGCQNNNHNRVVKTTTRSCQNDNLRLSKRQPQKNTQKKSQKNIGQTTSFDRFWEAYPKKVQKKPSMDIWRRKKLDDIADLIVENVTIRRDKDGEWVNGFVPNPTTYLNQERWQDESPTRATVRKFSA